MRLFTKSPPSPQLRGTNPSSNKQTTDRPKNIKGQRHQSASPSITEADPYALTRVLTAHGYESDDSDAELERMPSRYDLNASAPDDIAFDDCRNDRYSQVVRPLALMTSDSDSVQWRSLDEYDERDPNSAVYDPLVFDGDNEDWDDDYSWHEPFDSAEDYRSNPRGMRSLTDNPRDINDDDESPEPSISSVLDSEEDAQNSVVDSRQGLMEERGQLPPSNENVSEVGILNIEGDGTHVTAEKRTGSNSTPDVIRPEDDKVSTTAKSSVQELDNIIERVAHELNASKEREQNRKDAKKLLTTKRFGLFRRKAPRDSDDHAKSRPMDQQQLRPALENQSEAQTSHANFDMEGPVNPAPRSILRASSFAPRPEGDINQKDQRPSEAAVGLGFVSLLSSLLVGSNAEAPVTGEAVKPVGADSSKQESIARQEESFLGVMCGHPKAILNESSEVLVSPDPVMDIRSPIAKNADPAQDAVLTRRQTMQAEQESCNDKDGTLNTARNDGKGSKSRSMAVETEALVANEDVNAGHEHILVQCLRDSHCNRAADCIARSNSRLDNLGCQQTFEFMDDFITAKDPKLELPGVGLGIEARALSLEGKESGQRKGRKKKQQQQQQNSDANSDDGHDLPIKTIEFPVTSLDLESASGASLSSVGGRRKKYLYVDTHLEQEMRQMQDELSGSKKKSLFGRMRRSSKN